MDEVAKNIATLEKELGKKFGDAQDPLLVSVRSGAARSMPGMMNTILNLGLNDESVVGLANATGNQRFAYDAYRRLINMYGDVVCGVDHEHFEVAFDKIKKKYRAKVDTDVPLEGMIQLCKDYKAVFKKHFGKPFPQDPIKQLELAIEAVFKSWMQPRAVTYRQVENITGLLGTAVNVQSMVFGNMGDDSGTGVAFTRDPSTGENKFYGEFLINAQGEDVVAGIRTPQPVAEMPKWNKKCYDQLIEIKDKLEAALPATCRTSSSRSRRNTLFMLQTRNGKRTGAAAVKIACDMVKEKLIDEKTAVERIPAGDLTQLLLPSFSPAAKKAAERARRSACRRRPARRSASWRSPPPKRSSAPTPARAVLLVRKETNPEDIDGMHKAVGILTSTGGMTSHAAVVARGWGRCCVAGAGADHDRREGPQDQGRRQDLHPQGHALDRRLDRRSDGRQRRHANAEALGRLRHGDGLGRQVPHAEGPHQRRHAGRRQAGPRVRRRGHRPVPHRAHVLRRRPHHRRCGR